MVHEKWDEWLKLGRDLQRAPELGRGEKSERGREDPKWALGDLLGEIPEPLLESFARALNEDKGNFLRLREVAANWPPQYRVAASWSSHRDLKDHQDRFALIKPGMSVREAALAAGKKPIDAKPRARMTLDEKVTEVRILLGDKAVNDQVISEFRERGEKRRMQQAARAAADDRSAEYKEARRQLNEAHSLKSPERVILQVLVKIRESTEYVRAVQDASGDGEASFLSDQRRPDLIDALVDLADRTSEALGALRGEPPTRKRIVVEAVKTSRTANLLESTTNESRSDQ